MLPKNKTKGTPCGNNVPQCHYLMRNHSATWLVRHSLSCLQASSVPLHIIFYIYHPTLPQHHHHNHTAPQLFYSPFPGRPGWAGARRELLDFMVQGEIYRGRHTDHSAECHSVWINQCAPPPSPHIFLQAGCPSCHPTNSVKALKATRAFVLRRRC